MIIGLQKPTENIVHQKNLIISWNFVLELAIQATRKQNLNLSPLKDIIMLIANILAREGWLFHFYIINIISKMSAFTQRALETE